MNWLEKIRSQPVEKRIRLLWLIIAIAAGLLIIFWIIIGNYSVNAKPDTSLFKTLGKGVSNLNSQNFKSSQTNQTNNQ